MCTYWIYLTTDVVVRFLEVEFTEDEARTLNICATLSGPIERTVVVEITGQDNSATGLFDQTNIHNVYKHFFLFSSW